MPIARERFDPCVTLGGVLPVAARLAGLVTAEPAAERRRELDGGGAEGTPQLAERMSATVVLGGDRIVPRRGAHDAPSADRRRTSCGRRT